MQNSTVDVIQLCLIQFAVIRRLYLYSSSSVLMLERSSWLMQSHLNPCLELRHTAHHSYKCDQCDFSLAALGVQCRAQICVV